MTAEYIEFNDGASFLVVPEWRRNLISLIGQRIIEQKEILAEELVGYIMTEQDRNALAECYNKKFPVPPSKYRLIIFMTPDIDVDDDDEDYSDSNFIIKVISVEADARGSRPIQGCRFTKK